MIILYHDCTAKKNLPLSRKLAGAKKQKKEGREKRAAGAKFLSFEQERIAKVA
jgi:hypothetical protein